jgi:hypothetical protein
MECICSTNEAGNEAAHPFSGNHSPIRSPGRHDGDHGPVRPMLRSWSPVTLACLEREAADGEHTPFLASLFPIAVLQKASP